MPRLGFATARSHWAWLLAWFWFIAPLKAFGRLFQQLSQPAECCTLGLSTQLQPPSHGWFQALWPIFPSPETWIVGRTLGCKAGESASKEEPDCSMSGFQCCAYTRLKAALASRETHGKGNKQKIKHMASHLSRCASFGATCPARRWPICGVPRASQTTQTSKSSPPLWPPAIRATTTGRCSMAYSWHRKLGAKAICMSIFVIKRHKKGWVYNISTGLVPWKVAKNTAERHQLVVFVLGGNHEKMEAKMCVHFSGSRPCHCLFALLALKVVMVHRQLVKFETLLSATEVTRKLAPTPSRSPATRTAS